MTAENRTNSDMQDASGVHPVILASTVAFALSRGITMDQISAVTGLTGQDLVAGCSRPPEKALPLIWQLLAQEAKSDVPLTMEMAKGTPFSFFADVAHGMQFADTIGDALSLMVKHQRLLADKVEIQLMIEGNEAVLTAAHPFDSLDGGRTAEMAKALAWRLLKHLAVDPIQPIRVTFSHTPTGTIEGYHSVFAVVPQFGAERSAIVIPADVLKVPIQHASAELFSYVKEHLAGQERHLLASRVTDPLDPLRSSVIAASELGDFKPQTVARLAGMGYRNAQRLAARYGTTLGALIDENRFRLARELLTETTNTVDDIALILGFADDRAFRRAFKRIVGLSPSEYRRQQRRPSS